MGRRTNVARFRAACRTNDRAAIDRTEFGKGCQTTLYHPPAGGAARPGAGDAATGQRGTRATGDWTAGCGYGVAGGSAGAFYRHVRKRLFFSRYTGGGRSLRADAGGAYWFHNCGGKSCARSDPIDRAYGADAFTGTPLEYPQSRVSSRGHRYHRRRRAWIDDLPGISEL